MGDEIIEIQVGEFVKKHIQNIVDYCSEKPDEIDFLTGEDSGKTFGISFPFMSLAENVPEKYRRYWTDEYTLNHPSSDTQYRFCSQFANGTVDRYGKTTSQKRGEKFLDYINERNLLLSDYKDKKIKFIVGNDGDDDESNVAKDVKQNTQNSSIKQPLNQILYGPPGTGKTYHTINKAIEIIDNKFYQDNKSKRRKLRDKFKKYRQNGQIEFVTFHQSYGYEEFVEGIKADLESNDIKYKLAEGVFKNLCNKAKSPIKNYILIIDEINRGNISKIFGELITLIEPSKRIGADEEIMLKLPNSPELFGVPSNLYIIGTMNTADRSIAQIDTALRRRFEFVEMMPDLELLDGIKIEDIDIKEMLSAINERIEYIYDREHTIGHSYFLPLKDTPTKDKLDEIFRVNIIPLLAEYFYSDWEDIKVVLNDYDIKDENISNFIKVKDKSKLFIKKDNIDNKIYTVNDKVDSKRYRNIYQTNITQDND